jgi:hypothetical protein
MNRHRATPTLLRWVSAVVSCWLVGCSDGGHDIPLASDRGDAKLETGASDATVGSDQLVHGQGGSVDRADVATERDAGLEVVLGAEAGTADGAGFADGSAPQTGASDAGRDSGADLTTESILGDQSPDCFPCADRNGCLDPGRQGGTCEGTPGVAPVECGAVLGASSALTEALVCLATLNTIFTSKCAGISETPCLCGATDPEACLGGGAPPTGPALPLYTCDFMTVSVLSDFTNQDFGAGQANALVQCLAVFGCDCFP